MIQNSQRVFILYLEFQSSKRGTFRQFLVPFVARLFPKFEVHWVIIDNSCACEPEPGHPNLVVLEGDNSEYEFSGWRKGLRFIEKYRPQENDVVVFANDTFASNEGTDYLEFFDSKEVKRQIGNDQLIGYVDENHSSSEVFGLRATRWIRTSLFISSFSIAKVFGWFQLPAEDAIIFATSGASLFKKDAPISESAKDWIDHWLTMRPVPKGTPEQVWYKAESLNENNRSSLQKKAKSILHELWLSAMIQEKGFRLYNVRLSRKRAFGIFWFLDKIGLLERLRCLRRRLS